MKKKVSGSEAVLLSLLEEGVDTIFGYPGGSIMPIYDLLYDFAFDLYGHEETAEKKVEFYLKSKKK